MCRDEICTPRVMDDVRRDDEQARYDEAFAEGYDQSQEHELESQGDNIIEARDIGYTEGYESGIRNGAGNGWFWERRYNNLNMFLKIPPRQSKGVTSKFHRTTSM